MLSNGRDTVYFCTTCGKGDTQCRHAGERREELARRDAAWYARELGDVPYRTLPLDHSPPPLGTLV